MILGIPQTSCFCVVCSFKFFRFASGAFRRLYVVFGGGGYSGYFGIAGSIWSHGCASDTKKSICGRNQLGSSRLPAVTPTNSVGRSSDSPPVSREPHSAQKPRLCLPTAALDVKW